MITVIKGPHRSGKTMIGVMLAYKLKQNPYNLQRLGRAGNPFETLVLDDAHIDNSGQCVALVLDIDAFVERDKYVSIPKSHVKLDNVEDLFDRYEHVVIILRAGTSLDTDKIIPDFIIETSTNS